MVNWTYSKQSIPKTSLKQSASRSPHQTSQNALSEQLPADGRSASPQQILQLQRTVGNRAVNRLVAQATPLPVRARGTFRIQAKLAVGPGDDVYEREADQVADRVIHSSAIAPGREDAEDTLHR